MTSDYVTHYRGHPYVQLTFKPHNSKRKRTIWAVKLAPGVYKRADPEGGYWRKESATHVVEEIVMLDAADERVEVPAGLSKFYGLLEVL